MKLESFPKALYKGDSVSIIFNLLDRETKAPYIFKVGDLVQIGIKRTLEDTEYQVKKELTITEEGTDVQVYLTPQETDNLTITEEKGILEVRLVYNEGKSRATVYQDKIRLEGVVYDE